MKAIACGLAGLVWLMLAAPPVLAETLIVSLSNHHIKVTSNFSGEDLVLFGTIEPGAPGERLRGHYDIVATVVGPAQNLHARRKERKLGIWANRESGQFIGVPSYLAVIANRPLGEITSAALRRDLRIGLDNIPMQHIAGGSVRDAPPDDQFRRALVRIATAEGFYYETTDELTFLTSTIFRATVPLPATAPTGPYLIDVKVFADGKLITQGTTRLDVVKAGFEQFVATTARDHGLLYGLFAALLAMSCGWLASVIFRRD